MLMFLKGYSFTEIVLYMVYIYVFRYIIYLGLDYYENKDYKEEDKHYKYTKDFTMMNNIISYITRLFSKNEEGFQTYGQCRNLGYSKEFCVQTPTSLFGPADCMCPDGRMGATYPGLRGGCLCS